jgi:hypothetical protein
MALCMEPTHRLLTFIVRLTRADGGLLDGVVERVRTGEKRRFHGAAVLAEVVAAMAEREAEPGGES